MEEHDGGALVTQGSLSEGNRITDNLEAFLDRLPPSIVEALQKQENGEELLEIVLDLGRWPEARYPRREVVLSQREVTEDELDYVIARVGQFNADNRAGIQRTLHRISCIRNRNGKIVGLTCRVGRAVLGTNRIIEDFIRSGKSILLMGRPGVGKTTMLRETARVLADDVEKRVVIVDTSNEIAGDGDIPHPAIGHARRMQVPQPESQHRIMIEAVENHMPEVIVIDEIGTEEEAAAARTIAERGVQLIATAHGTTLVNLIMNPTLSDLIGGIQAVTLGDEEARRRGTQKTILERKALPTFEVVVEIQNWERVAIHPEVARTVDMLLRGATPRPLVRYLSPVGKVVEERGDPMSLSRPTVPSLSATLPSAAGGRSTEPEEAKAGRTTYTDIYPYGVGRGYLDETIRSLGLPLRLVDSVTEADVLLTTKQMYRRRPQPIYSAEAAGIPVHVLRRNNPPQIRQALDIIANAGVEEGVMEKAMEETEQAIQRILAGGEDEVALSPQGANVRRIQHQLATQHNISSRSSGQEPDRRVHLYKTGIYSYR
ncbi:MAG: AAA family ATPase [Chloroflexi bacterium]|nr:AAA family ATPase [Chloroflexota bacterium]